MNKTEQKEDWERANPNKNERAILTNYFTSSTKSFFLLSLELT